VETPSQPIIQAADRSSRAAAVILVLFPDPDPAAADPRILFTVRTNRVADHKGQICFPGGSREPDDEDFVTTAIRELAEETGVVVRRGQIVAALPPVYTVATRYVIHPFVAYLSQRPTIEPDDYEVAEVFDVSARRLLDPAIQRVENWDSFGVPREVYFFDCDEHIIWGATARILRQFLDAYTPEWWREVRAERVSYAPATEEPPRPV